MRSRRPLLTAALGFACVRADTPELRPLQAWLDSWRGIGAGRRMKAGRIVWHPWLRVERAARAILAVRLERGSREDIDGALMTVVQARERVERGVVQLTV
jgi:hypothetical protein